MGAMNPEDTINEILKDLATKVSSNQAAVENGNLQFTEARLYDDKCIAESQAALLQLIDQARVEAVQANQIELAKYITEHLAAGDLEEVLANRLAELKSSRGDK